ISISHTTDPAIPYRIGMKVSDFFQFVLQIKTLFCCELNEKSVAGEADKTRKYTAETMLVEESQKVLSEASIPTEM
ncbi:811_t:CDS:2, partial [Entrophospora sp. SA101]